VTKVTALLATYCYANIERSNASAWSAGMAEVALIGLCVGTKPCTSALRLLRSEGQRMAEIAARIGSVGLGILLILPVLLVLIAATLVGFCLSVVYYWVRSETARGNRLVGSDGQGRAS